MEDERSHQIHAGHGYESLGPCHWLEDKYLQTFRRGDYRALPTLSAVSDPKLLYLEMKTNQYDEMASGVCI